MRGMDDTTAVSKGMVLTAQITRDKGKQQPKRTKNMLVCVCVCVSDQCVGLYVCVCGIYMSEECVFLFLSQTVTYCIR